MTLHYFDFRGMGVAASEERLSKAACFYRQTSDSCHKRTSKSVATQLMRALVALSSSAEQNWWKCIDAEILSTKLCWNNKQDTIENLLEIRTRAAKQNQPSTFLYAFFACSWVITYYKATS